MSRVSALICAKRLECVELAPAFYWRGEPFHLQSAGKPVALQTLRDERSAVPDVPGIFQVKLRHRAAITGQVPL